MAAEKWTLIFDTEKCNGCCNCVLATMDEYVDNDHRPYAAPMPRHAHKWLDVECHERGAFPVVDIAYLLRLCQHCEDPPCAKPVPGAVTRRADGVVIIDPIRAKGARQIVDACPYGAVHWNEALQLPQHWNFDAHLLDQGWRDVRASQACPTGAIEVRKLSDAALDTARSEQGLEELRPELQSKPRVFYRNLHRVRSVFLAGTVLDTGAQQVDVLPEALVGLLDPEGSPVAQTHTDVFGDFRLDGLARSEAAGWVLEVQAPDGRMQRVPVALHRSAHVGNIDLSVKREM